MTWEEAEAACNASLLVVPLGSTEQHGPHLPLSTDTDVAVALAERLAELRQDAIVAPALPYGAAGEHRGFAGTLSLGQEALELAIVELVRSAWRFAGVLLLSAHGGNASPLARAVASLSKEGRAVKAWSPPPLSAGDAHAGLTETSLQLALGPGRVRLQLARAGDTRPLATLMQVLSEQGVAAVSPSGVLGDPAGSSASLGEELLSRWAADLLTSLKGWP